MKKTENSSGSLDEVEKIQKTEKAENDGIIYLGMYICEYQFLWTYMYKNIRA
jgi:hypothetical protein